MIDGAWRRLGPGLEPLSAPDGGPLSRTVKLVLLPLVLRPSLHHELGRGVLEESGADMVERLVVEHGQQLRATAAWFVVLVQHCAEWRPKDQVSRDSCYPKAFELAVLHGIPRPSTEDGVAADALAELAGARGEWTPAALRNALDDAHLRSTLSARLVSGWDESPAVPAVDETLLDDERSGLSTGSSDARVDQVCASFLDTFAQGGQRPEGPARGAADQAWTAVVDAGVGRETGRGLRADRWPPALPSPARARQLGLTDAEAPPRPALDRPTGSEARCPWDRSIAERVLGVLRHSTDRTALPALADLLAEEVERACAPWEVLEETSRAALVVGTVLVTELVGDPAPVGRTRAHRIVAGMRRRESWLAWAQRQPAVPAPQHGPGSTHALVAVGADLVPAYLRRLWVRLHGAETRGTLPAGAQEVQSLLLGVFRSVLLDGRSRVRAALTRLQGAQP